MNSSIPSNPPSHPTTPTDPSEKTQKKKKTSPQIADSIIQGITGTSERIRTGSVSITKRIAETPTRIRDRSQSITKKLDSVLHPTTNRTAAEICEKLNLSRHVDSKLIMALTEIPLEKLDINELKTINDLFQRGGLIDKKMSPQQRLDIAEYAFLLDCEIKERQEKTRQEILRSIGNPPTTSHITISNPTLPQCYIIREIFTTEASYKNQLLEMFTRLQAHQKSDDTEENKQKFQETCLTPLVKIILAQKRLAISPETFDIAQVEEYAKKNQISTPVTDKDIKQAYSEYADAFNSGLEAFKTAVNPPLQNLLRGDPKDINAHPDLQSLHITPIQRIPRYVLLYQDLLKKTPENDSSRASIQEKIEYFKAIGTSMNEKK